MRHGARSSGKMPAERRGGRETFMREAKKVTLSKAKIQAAKKKLEALSRGAQGVFQGPPNEIGMADDTDLTTMRISLGLVLLAWVEEEEGKKRELEKTLTEVRRAMEEGNWEATPTVPPTEAWPPSSLIEPPALIQPQPDSPQGPPPPVPSSPAPQEETPSQIISEEEEEEEEEIVDLC